MQIKRHVCYSSIMTLIYRISICLGIFALPFVSVAQGATEKSSYVMCRSQKTVRTIRVIDGSEACTTLYTKMGVDKVVGGGKNKQSCYDVMKNIRTNLEGAAWKCKDISASNVSELSN